MKLKNIKFTAYKITSLKFYQNFGLPQVLKEHEGGHSLWAAPETNYGAGGREPFMISNQTISSS